MVEGDGGDGGDGGDVIKYIRIHHKKT